MRYMLILIALISLSAKAQTLKEYKASNGIAYHPGDTVKLGMGSNPTGRFVFVEMGASMILATRSEERGGIKELSNSAFPIKKIKKFNGPGYSKIYFYTEKGLTISIEEAILKCEVIPCKNQ